MMLRKFKQQDKPVFGRLLEELVEENGGEIPHIVRDSVQCIYKTGMDEMGIFRLSGSHTKINLLKAAYNKGSKPDLIMEDVHTVAGLLKLFLREMKDPLMMFDLYDAWISAYSEATLEWKLYKLQQCYLGMKLGHRKVLKEIMWLSHMIAENEALTKMSSANLSIVFAPNIIRQRASGIESLLFDSSNTCSIVKLLIENYTAICESTLEEPMPLRPPPPPPLYPQIDDRTQFDTEQYPEEEETEALMAGEIPPSIIMPTSQSVDYDHGHTRHTSNGSDIDHLRIDQQTQRAKSTAGRGGAGGRGHTRNPSNTLSTSTLMSMVAHGQMPQVKKYLMSLPSAQREAENRMLIVALQELKARELNNDQ